MNNESLVPKNIFIVEDDNFLGSMLVSKFASSNIHATLFMNAEEMLKALDDILPDMILLDIYLPGMSGLEALAKIRNNPETESVIVMVVSNTDEKAARDTAVNLNAKFIIKAMADPSDIVKATIDEFQARKNA